MFPFGARQLLKRYRYLDEVGLPPGLGFGGPLGSLQRNGGQTPCDEALLLPFRGACFLRSLATSNAFPGEGKADSLYSREGGKHGKYDTERTSVNGLSVVAT
jgi:hypothetical protein